MLDMDNVLVATTEMRPLPATTSRLSQLLTAPDVDLREVARVVALDAPLTARLLRTANSALYAGKIQISSVDQAVKRLGSGIVLSLAMSAALKRELSTKLTAYGMAEGDLWRRSIASALAAESLKSELKRVMVPAVAITAALLHEIGKIVLARFVDSSTKDLLDRTRLAAGSGLEAAEMQVLGVNHAELGAIIARRWKLPRPIVHAIEHFPDPDAGTVHSSGDGERDAAILDLTCDTVHVADAIARRVATAEADALESIAPGARERLECGATLIDAAYDRTAKRFEETVALFA